MRVTLPMYRVVLNNDRPKNGKGVLPDIAVKPIQHQHLTFPPNALQLAVQQILQNK